MKKLCLFRRGWLALAPLLTILTGCASNTEDNLAYTATRGRAEQPYPADYRPEIVAFLRTYLNNPRGVRNGAISEPVQRSVVGRQRFVVCVRYLGGGPGDDIAGNADRAVLFIDGRLERLIEKASDLCAGVTYAPFPEIERLSR